MADQATIVVHPAGADSDLMPARDALNHVLDFLELLRFAEASEETPAIVWLLEDITSNSPITAHLVGEFQSNTGSQTFSATSALFTLESGIEAAMEGKPIPEWMLNGAFETVHRFFKRNTEVVGRTDLGLKASGEPTIIPVAKANAAMLNLQKALIERQQKEHDWTHTAYGSVEGRVLYPATYRNRPAIWIRERNSGQDIRCVFDEETADKVGTQYTWQAAWQHAHVIVEGAIKYNRAGEIEQVSAIDVIQSKESTSSDIKDISEFADPTFTSGMSPDAYLDRWRDEGRD